MASEVTWWGSGRFCSVVSSSQAIHPEVWLWLAGKELIVLDTETHCG